MSLKATYEAIQNAVMTGDFEATRRFIADDFVLSEPEVLPYGGQFYGAQGFVDLVAQIGKVFKIDLVSAGLTEGDNQMLVCEFALGFTSHRTGERLEMAMVDLYRFGDDGKMIRADMYYADPDKLAAIA